MIQSVEWAVSNVEEQPPSSRRRTVLTCEKGPRHRFLFHLDATLDKHGKRIKRGWARDEPNPVETVHDLRVSSRRLRAVVDLMGRFGDKREQRRARKALRAITRILGPLRELDVNRENIAAEMAFVGSGPERCAFEYLSNALSIERVPLARTTRKQLRRALKREPVGLTAKFMESAACALPRKGLRDRARVAVVDCADAVVAAAPRRDGVEDPKGMHAMRIAVKNLRYTVELLDPILLAPERTRVRLVDAQETLGRYHDLVVLDELMQHHQAVLESRDCHALARGLQAGRARIAEERRDLVTEYQRVGAAVGEDDIAALVA